MTRRLGPVDYGILASLLSILLIVSIPVSTIQTFTSRSITKFKIDQSKDEIKNFFYFLFKRLCICAAVVTTCLMALSPCLKTFLHLPGPVPIIILSISIFFVLIWPLFLGVLQGLERFISLGLNIAISTILRLVAGIYLVSCGLGVNGAIMASGISALSGIFLAYFSRSYEGASLFLRHRGIGCFDRGTIQEENLFSIFPMLLAFFCFTVITNIDVFMVRHFFSPLLAGYYGAASLIGKIIFYISTPIAMVIFPRITALYYQYKPGISILKKGLLLVTIISGLFVSFYFLFPSFFIYILPGKEYLPAASLIGLYGLLASGFSFIYIFLFYHLSRARIHFLLPLTAVMIAEIVLLSIFHTSLKQVLSILLILLSILLLWNVILVYKER